MIPDQLIAQIGGFFLIILCCFIAALVYRNEEKKIGGLGLGTMLILVSILYGLVNPFFYLINKDWAANYSGYIGNLTPAEILPGIIAVFLFTFAFSLFYLPLLKHQSQTSGEAKPLPKSIIKKLFLVALILLISGAALFFWRNISYFGSLFGSFNAQYAGSEARPQAGITSNYLSLLQWAIILFSIIIFWQVDARRWKKIFLYFPLIFGSLFAILEGNRVLAGTAILLLAGWYLLRAKITPKMIVTGILVLTLLTLLANARYLRGQGSFSQKISIMFDAEYFRPFWSGDPTGPNLVLTHESLRANNRDNVSWGYDYTRSIGSMVPSFLWQKRPSDPTVDFAKRYSEDYQNKEYIPGTGYAYSMIAESMTNFWYFGPLMLGLIWALLLVKITSWYSTRDPMINKAVAALGMYFVIWFVPRSNLFVYINLITITGLVFSWYILYRMNPRIIASPQSIRDEKRDD